MAALSAKIGFQSFKLPSGCFGSVSRLQTCQYSSSESDLRTIPHSDNLASLQRGTGGRSSFNGKIATVFGASGFIGRYVCNRLGKTGTQIIIPYRGDHYDVLRLRMVGDLGQVLFLPYNLRDEESIRKAIRYSNIVINLIGRDWETKNFKFDDIYTKGPRLIAKICRESGVERLIHFSSLNLSPNPTPLIMPRGSGILKAKYHGEKAVLEEFPAATIVRPADVYGQEDRFLRYYAHFWRKSNRRLPMWYKGERTVKQPVSVHDVANAVNNIIRDPETAGKIYQAVGPKRYKLSDLVDYFHRVMRRDEKWGYRRSDMRWDPIFQMKVTLTSMVCPGWPVGLLDWEKLETDHVSDVLTEGMPTLEDLGITPIPIEDRVAWELRPYRAFSYYEESLGEFEIPEPPKVVTI